MILEEVFSQGNSWLHRADPRGKVIAAIVLACCTAILQTLSAAALVFAAGLTCLFLARLPLKKVLKRIILINGFIAFLWIFLPFSTPGHDLISFWQLEATYAGLYKALLITLKSNAIIFVIISLISTTSIASLGQALDALRLPRKLILLFLIAYRYIHVLSDEYNRLYTAAKIRCFLPRSNMHTYRTLGYLLAMVFIKSYDRAQRVYQAMLLRGFSGRFRTLHNFAFAYKDIILIIALAAFGFFSLWVDIQGHGLIMKAIN